MDSLPAVGGIRQLLQGSLPAVGDNHRRVDTHPELETRPVVDNPPRPVKGIRRELHFEADIRDMPSFKKKNTKNGKLGSN
jgi:hypothetical protein